MRTFYFRHLSYLPFLVPVLRRRYCVLRNNPGCVSIGVVQPQIVELSWIFSHPQLKYLLGWKNRDTLDCLLQDNPSQVVLAHTLEIKPRGTVTKTIWVSWNQWIYSAPIWRRITHQPSQQPVLGGRKHYFSCSAFWALWFETPSDKRPQKWGFLFGGQAYVSAIMRKKTREKKTEIQTSTRRKFQIWQLSDWKKKVLSSRCVV